MAAPDTWECPLQLFCARTCRAQLLAWGRKLQRRASLAVAEPPAPDCLLQQPPSTLGPALPAPIKNLTSVLNMLSPCRSQQRPGIASPYPEPCDSLRFVHWLRLWMQSQDHGFELPLLPLTCHGTWRKLRPALTRGGGVQGTEVCIEATSFSSTLTRLLRGLLLCCTL